MNQGIGTNSSAAQVAEHLRNNHISSSISHESVKSRYLKFSTYVPNAELQPKIVAGAAAAATVPNWKPAAA